MAFRRLISGLAALALTDTLSELEGFERHAGLALSFEFVEMLVPIILDYITRVRVLCLDFLYVQFGETGSCAE